jgi:N-acetylneuraminate synthase
MKKHTYIIAEAGVNHNGSFDMACQLVDVAKAAGADAVKFQTYKTELLVTKEAQQAAYQSLNLGETTSQHDMLKKLELSYEEFQKLSNYCATQHIGFLSTPFDSGSVDFLVDTIHIKTIKIPSGELTNSPFVHQIGTKQLPIILSTGMSTLDEIHESLSFIAYGLAYPSQPVDFQSVTSFYKTKEAKDMLKKYVSVLHCTTSYPTNPADVHLKSIDFLRDELHLTIGFSDHSEGILIPIAAVARGATIIEKHFTLDKELVGPDHRASLNPQELKDMVSGIRLVEKAVGEYKKEPTSEELQIRSSARKSLIAVREIKSGEVFTDNHLIIKRPGTGMPPVNYWSILGQPASKDYKEGDIIEE